MIHIQDINQRIRRKKLLLVRRTLNAFCWLVKKDLKIIGGSLSYPEKWHTGRFVEDIIHFSHQRNITQQESFLLSIMMAHWEYSEYPCIAFTRRCSYMRIHDHAVRMIITSNLETLIHCTEETYQNHFQSGSVFREVLITWPKYYMKPSLWIIDMR